LVGGHVGDDVGKGSGPVHRPIADGQTATKGLLCCGLDLQGTRSCEYTALAGVFRLKLIASPHAQDAIPA
jgi:hypothetical protein